MLSIFIYLLDGVVDPHFYCVTLYTLYHFPIYPLIYSSHGPYIIRKLFTIGSSNSNIVTFKSYLQPEKGVLR